MSDEPMDIDRARDGHWHFRLGPVERWVLAVAFSLLSFLAWYVFHEFSLQLEISKDTQQKILINQAVTTQQLTQLTQQLSDVPGLTRQITELQVEVTRNSQDIHELQQVKGLQR